MNFILRCYYNRLIVNIFQENTKKLCHALVKRLLRLKIQHLVREIDHHLAHALQQTETEIADDILGGGFAGVASSVCVCPSVHGIHYKVRHHKAFCVKNLVCATTRSPLGCP